MAEEQKEKVGFFKRLVQGLGKTRDNIVSGMDSIFNGFSHIDEEFYEELEEVLDFCLDVGLPVCLADIGVESISPEELRQVAEKASIPEESTHAMPFPVNAQTVAAAIVAADKLGSTYKQERAK